MASWFWAIVDGTAIAVGIRILTGLQLQVGAI